MSARLRVTPTLLKNINNNKFVNTELLVSFANLIKYRKVMEYYLNPKKKEEIFKTHGKSNNDTGSPESQIALFSYRISHLTEHLKSNRKDFSTLRALIILVGKRRSLLDYLKTNDIERYRAIVKKLGLRR